MSEPTTPHELSLAGLPSSDELVHEDGVPMETIRHFRGMTLLIEQLATEWAERDDYFASGNNFLYFSSIQALRNDFVGPYFYLVLGVRRDKERKSWVVWEEENRVPDVVVELTSDSTRRNDHGRKKHLYSWLGVGTYVLFDPYSYDLEVYRLEGVEYVAIPPNEGGRHPVEGTGLELGLWEGPYEGVSCTWLRWFRPDGTVVPIGVERAEAERANAEAERANAEELAARLAAYEAKFGPLDG